MTANNESDIAVRNKNSLNIICFIINKILFEFNLHSNLRTDIGQTNSNFFLEKQMDKGFRESREGAEEDQFENPYTANDEQLDSQHPLDVVQPAEKDQPIDNDQPLDNAPQVVDPENVPQDDQNVRGMGFNENGNQDNCDLKNEGESLDPQDYVTEIKDDGNGQNNDSEGADCCDYFFLLLLF